jgi:hypothetical protein
MTTITEMTVAEVEAWGGGVHPQARPTDVRSVCFRRVSTRYHVRSESMP